LNVHHRFATHWRRLYLPLIHAHDVVMHRTRIHERIVIDHGYTVVDPLIHIRNIGDMIDGHVVINIGDLHYVHASVGDVHVLHIARTGPVPGDEYFSRAQREPSYANSYADVETASAADKRDQRR